VRGADEHEASNVGLVSVGEQSGDQTTDRVADQQVRPGYFGGLEEGVKFVRQAAEVASPRRGVGPTQSPAVVQTDSMIRDELPLDADPLD
jgi:hypothetical protein